MEKDPFNIKDTLKAEWNLLDVLYVMVFTLILSALIKYFLVLFNVNYKNFLIGGALQTILSIMPVLLSFIIIKNVYKLPLINSLGLKVTKSTINYYIWAGVKISILIIISSIVISAITIAITNKPMINPYSQTPLEKLKLISLLAVFLAPLVEEIFFRGFMQPAFCKIVGNVKGTIGVAMVFTLLHHQYLNNIPAIALLLSISLILGFARLYYKSTVPGIVGHMLNNSYAVVSLLTVKHL